MGQAFGLAPMKLGVQRAVVWGLFASAPQPGLLHPGCQMSGRTQQTAQTSFYFILFFFLDISWDKNYLGGNKGYVAVAVTPFVRQGQAGDRDTVTFFQPQHNELMLRHGAMLVLLQHLLLRKK